MEVTILNSAASSEQHLLCVDVIQDTLCSNSCSPLSLRPSLLQISKAENEAFEQAVERDQNRHLFFQGLYKREKKKKMGQNRWNELGRYRDNKQTESFVQRQVSPLFWSLEGQQAFYSACRTLQSCEN